jgi:hypothetical protein
LKNLIEREGVLSSSIEGCRAIYNTEDYENKNKTTVSAASSSWWFN